MLELCRINDICIPENYKVSQIVSEDGQIYVISRGTSPTRPGVKDFMETIQKTKNKGGEISDSSESSSSSSTSSVASEKEAKTGKPQPKS